MNREELLKLIGEKRAAALAIVDKAKAEKRVLTEDERTKVTEFTEAVKQARADLEALDIDEANQRILAEAGAETADDLPEEDERDENGKIVFPDADKRMEWKTAGHFLQAVAARTITQGLTSDPRLKYWNDRRMAFCRAEGMNVTIPEDGGFYLAPKHYDELLGVTKETTSKLLIDKTRQFSDNGVGIEIPRIVETSRAEGSRGGALRAYRKAETTSMTAATAKLGLLKLAGEELYFMLPVSNKLLSNAPALVSQVKGLVVPEMYHKIVYEMINGTGSGQCKGIINSACYIEVDKVNGQDADTIVYDNILDMEQRLDPESQMSAIWMINQFCVKQLRKLTQPVGTGGEVVKIWKFNQFAPGVHGLDDRPAIITEQNPKLGDKGDIILGDLSKYIMLFDPRVNGEASIHVYWLTNESAFRWVWNVNGETEDAAAKTSEMDSNITISSFIGLAERT